MKKIFVFLGIIAAVTMAAPRKTEFKKHVEYNYYFYAVDPIWESFSYAKGLTQKSFKKHSTISCDLTVDIGRFLIKNDGYCDFYDVSFYDSKKYFLGMIYDPYTSKSDTIKSGNYYSHFNESSSFINYLYISAMNARYTISNYWDPELGVIDEDDMPKGIRCKKSEVFMVTRYRTKKIGKSHYLLPEEFSDEYNPNAVCVEIETPPQGYYFVTGAFIEPLSNAQTRVDRKNDEGWECKAGYLLGYGDRCFKNCAENSYFDFHSETCQSIPANAHKAGDYSWDCDDGYFEEENHCQSVPANAHKTGFDKWECNEGFFKKNDLCEKIPDCGNFSYFDIKKEYCESCNANEVFRENSCESIPAHSTKISPTEWKCNDGYSISLEYRGVECIKD